MSKRGCMVWINGFPGVGKFTIAKELHRLLPGSVLVDNHSLIDQVTLPRDHADYNSQRRQVRDAAYTRWVHPETDEESECGSREEQLSRVVIFTDFFTSGELGTEWSTAVKTAADRAQRPFLPIYLGCARQENLERLVSPGRMTGERKKLTDVKLVEDFMGRTKPFRFEGLGVDIDVTTLSPVEAAERILWKMESLGRG